MPESDLTQQLENLRQSYRDQLPERLRHIDAAWAEVRVGLAEDTLRSLHRLVHKLAGSAACFGFAALGERATAAEMQLEEMLQGSRDCQAVEKLELLLNALREALPPTRPS